MIDKILNQLFPKIGKAKKSVKKYLIISSVLLVCYIVYSTVDTYFNKASAEANLQEHIITLYKKTPDTVKCPQTQSKSEENRVECTAMIDGVERVYLCRGLFDGFDHSCVARKASNNF